MPDDPTNLAPLLSIIIPAYNSAATLPRTLQSLNRIRRGNRASVEIVFIDDGSTDPTLQLMREFARSGSFPHVTCIDQPNGGSSAARNAGLAGAEAPWIFFLDSDDELAFDPVPLVRKWDGRATSLGFAVILQRGRIRFRWPAQRLTRQNHLDVLTAKSALYPSNVIFRADCIGSPFQTRYRYNEDWHFWLANPEIFRLMRIVGGTVAAIIHAHGGNKSSHFESRGHYRGIIAEEFLASSGSQLTPRQRNNLLIQSRIASLQQGRPIALATFALFPCDLSLYLKLIVYRLLKQNLSRLELYRPRKARQDNLAKELSPHALE